MADLYASGPAQMARIIKARSYVDVRVKNHAFLGQSPTASMVRGWWEEAKPDYDRAIEAEAAQQRAADQQRQQEQERARQAEQERQEASRRAEEEAARRKEKRRRAIRAVLSSLGQGCQRVIDSRLAMLVLALTMGILSFLITLRLLSAAT
jgi:flagellar biosynthesis/type III secretory pathway protein FliH